MTIWTDPRTWVNGEVPDEDVFNVHVRDNMLHLKEQIVPQVNNVILADEFMGLSVETGEIGALGWAVTLTGTGGIAAGGDVALHPGFGSLTTGTTSGSKSIIDLLRIKYQDWDEVAFIVSPNSIGAVHYHVGMVDFAAMQNMNEDHDGVFFSFDSVQSINWRSVTRNGGTKTAKSTGVLVVAGSFFLLEIKKKGTDLEFYVNGVLKTTHVSATDNLPDAADGQTAKFGVTNTTTANKQFSYDFFRLIGQLGDRFN